MVAVSLDHQRKANLVAELTAPMGSPRPTSAPAPVFHQAGMAIAETSSRRGPRT
jgi:hypothetical protein